MRRRQQQQVANAVVAAAAAASGRRLLVRKVQSRIVALPSTTSSLASSSQRTKPIIQIVSDRPRASECARLDNHGSSSCITISCTIPPILWIIDEALKRFRDSMCRAVHACVGIGVWAACGLRKGLRFAFVVRSRESLSFLSVAIDRGRRGVLIPLLGTDRFW